MTTTKMETTEEEANDKSFSRVKELRSMFEESLTMCFEVKTIGVRLLLILFCILNFFVFFFPRVIACDVTLTFVACALSLSLSLATNKRTTIQEFAAFFPTLPKEYHVPLYDLYSQLYASIKEKSREEFEQILKEESLEIKLKAIDDACVARGIDMNARVNSIEAIAEDMVSKVVAPEEAARAARADAKRRELILLEEECEKERVVEEEHVRILEEKRREVQMAAGRVGRAQNELEEVRDASLQWAGRQAYVSR